MAPPIYLSLVFHNHQPVGQFDYVNEHAANVAYLPLIELLERFPTIHVGIHFSGQLLNWLCQHHASAIDRLGMLITRGQVEPISGGYYEPILVGLPDEDKIGQIRKLTDHIRALFGVEPTGAWLAEHVWEPHLPRVLSEADVRYVILDDQQFESAGLDRGSDLFGYYMTEEQGHVLALFPSFSHLQKAMPWGPIDRLLTVLRSQLENTLGSGQPKLLLCAQDGEKFGAWPGSYEKCWGDGKYMETLFAAMEREAAWLKLTTPAAFMRRVPALGRAYLPSTNQSEMDGWSLPANAAIVYQQTIRASDRVVQNSRFVRGGIWRGFLMKYDEVNHLHKRMLAVSLKVHAMRRGRKRDEALELLWQAQAGDTYWHGIYGGIYLFKLRAAVYKALLAAEAIADGDYSELKLWSHDFDADGRLEAIIVAEPFNAIWAAGNGGALIELDYKPDLVNILNVMTRYPERYHQDLIHAVQQGAVITPDSPLFNELELIAAPAVRAKETGLEQRILYDWHRRASYIDHFLREDTTLTEFYKAHYAEQGDFVNLPYRLETKSTAQAGRVALTRDGHVWLGSKHQAISISKIFSFEQHSNQYTVNYLLSHPSAVPVHVRFAVETVIGFDGGSDFEFCGLTLNHTGVRRALNTISEFAHVYHSSVDNRLRGLTVDMQTSLPATLWWFPLETVALSDSGFERNYQGTVFLHIWDIVVPPERAWSVTITQQVNPLTGPIQG